MPEHLNEICGLRPARLEEFVRDYDRLNMQVTKRISDAKAFLANRMERQELPTAPTPLPRPSGSTSHLPRLDALKFSGKVEEFPEFKRNWLARYGKLDNDTQL